MPTLTGPEIAACAQEAVDAARDAATSGGALIGAMSVLGGLARHDAVQVGAALAVRAARGEVLVADAGDKGPVGTETIDGEVLITDAAAEPDREEITDADTEADADAG